jgi:subtilisin family serine protease
VPVANCLAGNINNAVGADDPFYANSWQLENTGPTQAVSAGSNSGVAGIDANVKSVHLNGRGCTGKGVTVAILDSGLELAHEDLAPNVLAGRSFNFSNSSSDPSPPANQPRVDHGTGVAGVAVARGWNGKGARGTAPFASVVGFNVLGAGFNPASTGDPATNIDFLAAGARVLADQADPVTVSFGNRADTVDIFNMSYGRDYGAPPLIADFDSAHKALQNGNKNLRSGRGAVYFQSAGNEFTSIANATLPSGQSIAINCADALSTDLLAGGPLAGSVFSSLAGQTCGSPDHEPNNKPVAYMVAAMHNTGQASSYSSSGASNWISGFGGEFGGTAAALISTDNSGCSSGANNSSQKSIFERAFALVTDALRAIADLFGASTIDPDCNYTGQMNGTSAAAPSISGVAALMFEANPNLTWQDVGFILAKTARKVDTAIASGAREVSFTAAGTTSKIDLDKPWQTNSAGFNFQNRYGFGMVDAAAAVTLARGFATPAGRRADDLVATGRASTATDTGGGKYTVNTAAVTFADAVAVTGQMRVELEFTNNTGADVNPGMVQVELVNNKTGQTSIMLPAFTSWYVGGKTNLVPSNGKQKFRLHSNAFLGEKLSDGYTVNVTYVKAPTATAGVLSFTPTLTSFSL